jgi:hypothetical protein
LLIVAVCLLVGPAILLIVAAYLIIMVTLLVVAARLRVDPQILLIAVVCLLGVASRLLVGLAILLIVGVILFVVAASVLVVAAILLAAVVTLPMVAATQRLALSPGFVAHVLVLHPSPLIGLNVRPLGLAMPAAAVAVCLSLRILLLAATAPLHIPYFVDLPLLVVELPCSQGRPPVVAIPVTTNVPLQPASGTFAAARLSIMAPVFHESYYRETAD